MHFTGPSLWVFIPKILHYQDVELHHIGWEWCTDRDQKADWYHALRKAALIWQLREAAAKKKCWEQKIVGKVTDFMFLYP